jgi:hypothetical protein
MKRIERLGGNSITLTGTITNNDDSLQTINLAMDMATTRTVNAASGDVALGGIFSATGSGTLTRPETNICTGRTIIMIRSLGLTLPAIIEACMMVINAKLMIFGDTKSRHGIGCLGAEL